MKAQISITPKFEDVNSKDYIDALVVEGNDDIIINTEGKKSAVYDLLNSLLKQYGIDHTWFDYKDKYEDCGNTIKVKYYYQDLPVLIVVSFEK